MLCLPQKNMCTYKIYSFEAWHRQKMGKRLPTASISLPSWRDFYEMAVKRMYNSVCGHLKKMRKSWKSSRDRIPFYCWKDHTLYYHLCRGEFLNYSCNQWCLICVCCRGAFSRKISRGEFPSLKKELSTIMKYPYKALSSSKHKCKICGTAYAFVMKTICLISAVCLLDFDKNPE